MTTQKLAGVWQAMLRRCRREDVSGYADWGGRGIRVCPRWHTYANFAEDVKRIPASKKIGIKEGATELGPDTLVWVPRANLKARNDAHPSYKSWVHARKKAHYTNEERKVTMPASWETFEGFVADMGKRPAGTQLARRDETEPYSKENCYWKKI